MKHLAILSFGLFFSISAFSQAKSGTEIRQAEKKENVQEVKISPEKIEAMKAKIQEARQRILTHQKEQQAATAIKLTPAKTEEDK